MDRPLGFAIGNAIETEEAILTLHGEGPADLVEVTLALAAEMLVLAGRETERQSAYEAARHALADGRALEKMRLIIEAQDGNPAVLDDPALLPQAPVRRVFESKRDGYIGQMQVREIGEAAVAMGAGRASIDGDIDLAVGFFMTAKTGQRVARGEPLATVFARSESDAEQALAALERAVPIGAHAAAPLPLISHRVTAHGIEQLT
jgi:pyrimidine-nucleoside phosphorylase